MLGVILKGAKGLKGVPVGKFAGDARKFLLPENIKAGEMALRILPDAGFGILAGASLGPEADLLDRILVGSTQAAGGIGGGLVAGGVARKLGAPGTVESLADMAGSIAGDMGAMNIGLGATALKDKIMGGEGLNPYEKMSAAQQKQLQDAITAQVMSAYGIVPGTLQDNYLASTGLV